MTGKQKPWLSFLVVAPLLQGKHWSFFNMNPLRQVVGTGDLEFGTVPAGHQPIPGILQTFASRGGSLGNAAKHAPGAFGFTQFCTLPSVVGGASHGIGLHISGSDPPCVLVMVGGCVCVDGDCVCVGGFAVVVGVAVVTGNAVFIDVAVVGLAVSLCIGVTDDIP